MKAIWKDVVIAESDATVIVEGNHSFPPAAIRAEHFQPSDAHTVCPWKGTASYYDVVVNGMKFGPNYANQLRKRQERLGDTWFMDEAVIVTVQGNAVISGVLLTKTITSSTFWFRSVKTNKPRSVSAVRC